MARAIGRWPVQQGGGPCNREVARAIGRCNPLGLRQLALIERWQVNEATGKQYGSIRQSSD